MKPSSDDFHTFATLFHLSLIARDGRRADAANATVKISGKFGEFDCFENLIRNFSYSADEFASG